MRIGTYYYADGKSIALYVKETEDGYYKWYDSMGESTNDFDSIDEAFDDFVNFMKEECEEVYVRRHN